MSDLAIQPLTVDLGAPAYWPQWVTAVRQSRWLWNGVYRTPILDTVQISQTAVQYIWRYDAPGPDQNQSATQSGAGPIQSFVPGDYTGAVLVGQNLQGVVFVDANMDGVNFSSADLQNSQFVNTSVVGAQFNQTNLTGADLSGAVGLEAQQLYQANFDTSTTMPSNIDSSIYGPNAT